MRGERGFLLARNHLQPRRCGLLMERVLLVVAPDIALIAPQRNPQHFASSSQAAGRILTLAYEHPAATTTQSCAPVSLICPVAHPIIQHQQPGVASSSSSCLLHRPLIPHFPLISSGRQRHTQTHLARTCQPGTCLHCVQPSATTACMTE